MSWDWIVPVALAVGFLVLWLIWFGLKVPT
jgi:hypothetical protein